MQWLFALVWLPACSFVAAVDPARDAAPRLDAPAIPFQAGCAECASRACTAEARACAEAPGCAPLARCLAALSPGDVAGRGRCEAEQQSALDDAVFAPLDRCLRAECLDACLGRGGIFASACSSECSACRDFPAACGEAVAACVADGACERAFRGCLDGGGPPDPNRLSRCYFLPANVSPVTDRLQACVATSCSEPCVYPDLRCTPGQE